MLFRSVELLRERVRDRLPVVRDAAGDVVPAVRGRAVGHGSLERFLEDSDDEVDDVVEVELINE